MITYTKGNLFDSTADALVCTVNCVGVMGKGVALQFKQSYPSNFFTEYVASCKSGRLRPGYCEVWEDPEEIHKPVILMATKDSWRYNSQMEWIKSGVRNLALLSRGFEFSSVALPPPGCGNGGLKWPDVKSVVDLDLRYHPTMFYVYEP